jgi:hypothetical protein
MSRKKNAEQHPCACGRVEVVLPAEALALVPRKHRRFLETEAPDEAGWLYLATECEVPTWGTFAPGHDARLAGLLQTADRADGYATLDGGTTQLTGVDAAARLSSEGLAAKVAAPAPTRKAKARKATEPAEVAEPVAIRAKVGRWVHFGTVDAEGVFAYVAKKTGQVVRVAPGKWSEVAEEVAA